jgi:hypothetical protein
MTPLMLHRFHQGEDVHLSRAVGEVAYLFRAKKALCYRPVGEACSEDQIENLCDDIANSDEAIRFGICGVRKVSRLRLLVEREGTIVR